MREGMSMTRYNRKYFGCKVNGCQDKHEGLGYCKKHYLKLYRHGDPLAMPRVGKVKTGKHFNCQSCGKQLYVILSRFRKGHFCSKKCHAKFQIGKHASPETILKRKQWRLNKSPSWKGGRTKTPEGYILLKMPTHPFAKPTGYIYEHRFVMEKRLGRYLKNEEHIHHVNGVKNDNRIDNLVILSNTEHKRLHCRK